jgi:hypothetical protein
MARGDEGSTVQIGLRVKEPLRARLEEAAREQGISMNAEIVRRLEDSFVLPALRAPFGVQKELTAVFSDLVNTSQRLAGILSSYYSPDVARAYALVDALTQQPSGDDK